MNNKRSFSEWFSHIFHSLIEIDVLAQLLGVILGLGCLGYVVTTWVQHLVQQGSYLFGALLAAAGLAIASFALMRVPAALIVVFGGAIICATAFFGGFAHVLLP